MLLSGGFLFACFEDVLGLLSVGNLSVVKSDRLLFDNINFSVEPGTLLYVKGPNGAGKTSLLRTLTGLHQAEVGEVFYCQQNIQSIPETYQRALVYFGHKSGLNLRLTAIENLQFWCRLQNITPSLADLYSVLAVLKLVGLEDMPVAHLSAGQQRRVALARLWLKTSAQLWILDEPFTALDKQGIETLVLKFVTFLSEGGAIIMTSHQDLEFDYPKQELVLEYRL